MQPRGDALAGAGLSDAGTTLDLTEWSVSPGDLVEVAATPNDGALDGNVGRAAVTVETEPEPPAAPVITAAARTGATDYIEGRWSTAPVTVT